MNYFMCNKHTYIIVSLFLKIMSKKVFKISNDGNIKRWNNKKQKKIVDVFYNRSSYQDISSCQKSKIAGKKNLRNYGGS